MLIEPPLSISPQQAAVLFDYNGKVIWTVRDRATITGLCIERLDIRIVQALRAQFKGSTSLRFSTGRGTWTVFGRQSDVFAEVIRPYLEVEKVQKLIDKYRVSRREIDKGRGPTGVLSDDDLARRRELEQYFINQQEK